jgi:hypothetical protein
MPLYDEPDPSYDKLSQMTVTGLARHMPIQDFRPVWRLAWAEAEPDALRQSVTTPSTAPCWLAARRPVRRSIPRPPPVDPAVAHPAVRPGPARPGGHLLPGERLRPRDAAPAGPHGAGMPRASESAASVPVGPAHPARAHQSPDARLSAGPAGQHRAAPAPCSTCTAGRIASPAGRGTSRMRGAHFPAHPLLQQARRRTSAVQPRGPRAAGPPTRRAQANTNGSPPGPCAPLRMPGERRAASAALRAQARPIHTRRPCPRAPSPLHTQTPAPLEWQGRAGGSDPSRPGPAGPARAHRRRAAARFSPFRTPRAWGGRSTARARRRPSGPDVGPDSPGCGRWSA